MNLLALIAILAIPSRANLPVQYIEHGAVGYSDADKIDFIAIVEPTGDQEVSWRTFTAVGPQAPAIRQSDHRSASQTVKVISSSNSSPGEVFTLVTRPISNPELDAPLKVGNRYLVLARSEKNGQLEFPLFLSYTRGSWCSNASDHEVAALQIFPTNATSVTGGTPRAEMIANNVVNCLEDAEPTVLRKLLSWFEWNGYPGPGFSRIGEGRETFPLAERIKSLTLNAAPSRRLAILQLLCAWRIYGSEQPMLDAALDAAYDPEGDLSLIHFVASDLDFSQRRSFEDPSYQGFRIDPNRLRQAILKGRCPRIQSDLLTYFSLKPARLRDLLPFEPLLGSTDDRLVLATAKYISAWLRDPELKPKLRIENERQVWDEKEETISKIKSALKRVSSNGQ